MRVKVSLVLILVASLSAFGQSTTVLENNPNLKWRQVKSPHFTVIFPEGFEAQAQRMANTLEHIRLPESKTLGGAPVKFLLYSKINQQQAMGLYPLPHAGRSSSLCHRRITIFRVTWIGSTY